MEKNNTVQNKWLGANSNLERLKIITDDICWWREKVATDELPGDGPEPTVRPHEQRYEIELHTEIKDGCKWSRSHTGDGYKNKLMRRKWFEKCVNGFDV